MIAPSKKAKRFHHSRTGQAAIAMAALGAALVASAQLLDGIPPESTWAGIAFIVSAVVKAILRTLPEK
ncbi:MAG: hypothetical protein UY96_C0017G0038 [Parcubacteria group bacterium GW2011_GWB1_56_8]|nr:MAG: hypothetical protein UY96_C0017G0038 [Parcubacteria group bacterium GW2011_GWB1_56_8]